MGLLSRRTLLGLLFATIVVVAPARAHAAAAGGTPRAYAPAVTPPATLPPDEDGAGCRDLPLRTART